MRVQNDVLQPALPRLIGPEVQRRFDQGNAFEAVAIAQLESLGGAARVVEEVDGEDLGVLAEEDVAVLLGARLPIDRAGRRVGRPDILVHAPSGGFRAVDVKHHMVLEPAGPDARGLPTLVSPWERPAFEDATSDDHFTARKREDDLLQLAHYQRMLEAAGLAARDGRWGGILGTERRIVWYDLDAPIWRHSAPDGRQTMQSSMERYDSEFELRLRVIAAALAHKEEPSVELLMVPVRIGECDECPWWDYCKGRLREGWSCTASADIPQAPGKGRKDVPVWRRWSGRSLVPAVPSPRSSRLTSWSAA
jgi:hypothetical protein